MRVGFGYDVHRLEQDRPLVLGGVEIPYELGLAGHSDADVLLHAIADALLGAAGLEDIGTYFPDSDDEWAGADSQELLRRVREIVLDAGYEVHNVDATIVIERPVLRPYIGSMRENVASCVGVAQGRVAVKATTNEGVGPIGREEGAEAHAVCTVQPV